MAGFSSMMFASSAINSVTSISSAYSQSQAIRMRGDFEKRMGDINAGFADMGAKDAIARGEQGVRLNNTRVKEVIGAQRASLAAQGVDVNSGSAADVQKSSAAMGALDAMTIRNNAMREALGYKVQALDYRIQGGFAQAGSRFDAANTFLTGGMKSLGYGSEAAYWYGKNSTGGGNPPVGYASPGEGGWNDGGGLGYA